MQYTSSPSSNCYRQNLALRGVSVRKRRRTWAISAGVIVALATSAFTIGVANSATTPSAHQLHVAHELHVLHIQHLLVLEKRGQLTASQKAELAAERAEGDKSVFAEIAGKTAAKNSTTTSDSSSSNTADSTDSTNTSDSADASASATNAPDAFSNTSTDSSTDASATDASADEVTIKTTLDIPAANSAGVQKASSSTPSETVTGSDVWSKLAQCESGGKNVNTGNGYYGYFQFSAATWRAIGGTGLPSDHSYADQLAMAKKLKETSSDGWNFWPTCSKKIGAV